MLLLFDLESSSKPVPSDTLLPLLEDRSFDTGLSRPLKELVDLTLVTDFVKGISATESFLIRLKVEPFELSFLSLICSLSIASLAACSDLSTSCLSASIASWIRYSSAFFSAFSLALSLSCSARKRNGLKGMALCLRIDLLLLLSIEIVSCLLNTSVYMPVITSGMLARA